MRLAVSVPLTGSKTALLNRETHRRLLEDANSRKILSGTGAEARKGTRKAAMGYGWG
jgi:hypothetical protein